ncbi:MAG: hypothetical protein MUC64_17655, partial [Rubritepida sp.]|nr:hypothetical protein [Rubritepida sp.]
MSRRAGAPRRSGPGLAGALPLSLALHAAALAAIALALRAPPPSPDTPPAVEIVWDEASPETVGGGETTPTEAEPAAAEDAAPDERFRNAAPPYPEA